MDFVTASRSLPPQELADVNHILRLWASNDNWEGQILVSNLENEQFLELGAWTVLFNEIRAAYKRFQPKYLHEWRAFQDYLNNVCQAKLKMRGGPIRSEPSPILVGVVMPRNRFENHLFEHCPQRFRDRLAFDALYLNCRRHAGNFQLPPDLRKALVAEADQLLWMTWDDKSKGQGSPFLFASHQGDEHPEYLRVGLGMGNPAYFNKGLVTLVFEQSLASLFDVQPHCPTFTDSDLDIFFFPGRSQQGYGMTHPLMGGQVRIDDKTYIVRSRPEAVQYSKHYSLGFLLNLTEHRY